MRKTLWEWRCEKDVVRKTLWVRCDKINLKKDVVRKTLWEKHCRLRRCERCDVNYIVRKTMWERHCEKDVVRKTLWERRYEEDVVRKTLRERRRFIFDGASPSINLQIYKLRKCRIRFSTKTFFFHIRYFVYANWFVISKEDFNKYWPFCIDEMFNSIGDPRSLTF